MTALSADKPRTYAADDSMNAMPVKASSKIYEGAPIGDDGSGYARNLVAGDPFRGFAYRQADNTNGAAGDINVNIVTEGYIKLAVGSLAITDVGKPVYASDSDTFTLTATSNSYIGRVHRFVSSGVGIIEFDADKSTLGSISSLTDSTGGTASTTLAAIATGTPADLAAQAAINTAIRNSISSLAAIVNGLQQQLK